MKNCFSAGPSEEIQKNNPNEMIVELIPKIKLLSFAEISSKLDIFFEKRVKTQSEYPSWKNCEFWKFIYLVINSSKYASLNDPVTINKNKLRALSL